MEIKLKPSDHNKPRGVSDKIRLKKDTIKVLKSLKLRPQETYDQVLIRLLHRKDFEVIQGEIVTPGKLEALEVPKFEEQVPLRRDHEEFTIRELEDHASKDSPLKSYPSEKEEELNK